ncbi:hypothetical protein NTG1052_290004 [Candidatus Nitrotoga sp. 1052]|nr:hypothetical protein NTG1052_290004 [Candidatus Nitrotoga sp. 1052]
MGQGLHDFADGRESHACFRTQQFEGGNGVAAQGVEYALGIGRAAPGGLYVLAILLEQFDQPLRGLHGALRGLRHTFEEKVDPGFPVAIGAHPVEQLVIQGAMLFEIQTQVQQRLREQAALMQQQRDEQAAEPAISIEKGVDGFKLHMRQSSLDQHGGCIGWLVDELFQRCHAGFHFLRRGRHEAGIAGAGAADPALAAAKVPRRFVAAATARHEVDMHFAQ